MSLDLEKAYARVAREEVLYEEHRIGRTACEGGERHV